MDSVSDALARSPLTLTFAQMCQHQPRLVYAHVRALSRPCPGNATFHYRLSTSRAPSQRLSMLSLSAHKCPLRIFSEYSLLLIWEAFTLAMLSRCEDYVT